MLQVLNIALRWLVGLLFIVSGLVKVNDPAGLSYKMQEFFEVWGWHGLHNYTLWFAIAMNIFEVVAGVAVITGWQQKIFNWLLLLLIIVFTFLTGYALFSGKIKTCGCFGDCLPLTPLMSFGKDIVLLALILLFFKIPYSSPYQARNSIMFIALALVFSAWAQVFVLKHLPFVDCLPYKKGNNILEQMQVPAGALPDSISIVYRYQKNGKTIHFDADHFPADFDSSYVFIDRKDVVVRKGNAIAPISDFSLITLNNSDTTDALLQHQGTYYLLLMKDAEVTDPQALSTLIQTLTGTDQPWWIVTADVEAALAFAGHGHILKADATVIKTAARVNPTLFKMKGAVIEGKRALADATSLIQPNP
jgi:uncharacterized membrane protein YphA (DoxX/SURF4 family)